MSKPTIAICRLCGLKKELTFEHIPPKSAFNSSLRTFETMQNLIEGRGHHKFRKGIGAYSLCAECNNLTGSWYGTAFAVWARQAMQIHHRIGDKNHIVPFYLPFQIQPLNVLKQVLVMAVALSSAHVNYHQELRAFLLNKKSRNVPPKYRVHTYFNVAGKPRFMSGGAIMSFDSVGSYVEAEIALPPLGYCITTPIKGLKSLADFHGLYDMTWFQQFEYGVWSSVFMQIPAKETHEPLPLDYRTEGQVKSHYEDQGIEKPL